MKKTITIIIIVAVLAAGGFLYVRYQNAKAQSQTSYQTVQLEKGDLTAIVGATGTVRAKQSTTVTWQTSGRIGSIDVQVGDHVTANQVLAQLDPATLPQNVILATSDLVTAQQNLTNLEESGVARAQAQQNLANAEKSLQDAQKARYQKNLARVSQATIDSAQADLIIAQDNLKTAQQNYDKFVHLPENNVMRAQAYNLVAQAQQKVNQDQYNLDWLLGRPDSVEIAQADAAIAVAQAQLADAQRQWARLKNGPDPHDIEAAQAKVASIEATLASQKLVAPISGTVTNVASMVGDQVNPGTVSFQVDDLSQLLVDVPVAEVDINKVQLGQPVTLTFDAISGKTYNGKVTQIASFGTTQQGVVNFTVTVALTNPDVDVKPGMTAAVNITVEQLSNVLLVPNRAVRYENGNQVIYLLKNGTPTPVNITLGATSDTNTQVLRGNVQAGDTIILNPPATLTSGGRLGIFGGR